VPVDVYHAASRRWLEQYTAGGGVVIGPALLLAEVTGAIARRTGEPRLAHQAMRQMLRVPRFRLVGMDSRLAEAAARLAADLGLRGADAVYVATAQQLNVPLVTWDSEQQTRTGSVIVARPPAP
jgi:predicted nucleic acid-binding protein